MQGHKYNETVLLGITDWNLVHGRESLINSTDIDREFIIKYPIVDPIDINLSIDKKKVSNEIELNKDHGHFLLVDCPNKKTFKEVKFRFDLENRLISEENLGIMLLSS